MKKRKPRPDWQEIACKAAYMVSWLLWLFPGGILYIMGKAGVWLPLLLSLLNLAAHISVERDFLRRYSQRMAVGQRFPAVIEKSECPPLMGLYANYACVADVRFRFQLRGIDRVRKSFETLTEDTERYVVGTPVEIVYSEAYPDSVILYSENWEADLKRKARRSVRSHFIVILVVDFAVMGLYRFFYAVL